MELVSVMVECDYTGKVKAGIHHAQVEKETAKLIKLTKGDTHYRIQYTKTEMGYMNISMNPESFRLWCVDIKQDKKHLDDMVTALTKKAEEIIEDRKTLALQWEEGMSNAISMLQG